MDGFTAAHCLKTFKRSEQMRLWKNQATRGASRYLGEVCGLVKPQKTEKGGNAVQIINNFYLIEKTADFRMVGEKPRRRAPGGR
jgi:hypothetical protein